MATIPDLVRYMAIRKPSVTLLGSRQKKEDHQRIQDGEPVNLALSLPEHQDMSWSVTT